MVSHTIALEDLAVSLLVKRRKFVCNRWFLEVGDIRMGSKLHKWNEYSWERSKLILFGFVKEIVLAHSFMPFMPFMSRSKQVVFAGCAYLERIYYIRILDEQTRKKNNKRSSVSLLLDFFYFFSFWTFSFYRFSQRNLT